MDRFDAVIVGSGYGGAIPAARLAEAGMSVLVLERGPKKTSADFQQTEAPGYLATILDLVVSSSNIIYRTGKLLGGASSSMDGGCFRAPSKTFGARDEAGRARWPEAVSRETLDPFYATAESMLRVRQVGWSEISRAGGLVAKLLDRAGASCDLAPMNYGDCVQCGFCAQGCRFDKKVTLLHSYIPFAESYGARFTTGADVATVEPEGTGYRVQYREGGEPKAVFGQRVIIAGGGIHSPALLLRSRSHLPNLSAQVGKNLNTNGEAAFLGILPPDFEGVEDYACYKGMENAGVMSFHWFEEDGISLHAGGGIEPSLFAATLAAPDHPVLPRRAWGLEYKRFIESVYPHRLVIIAPLGLPDGHGTVVVRRDGSPDVLPGTTPGHERYQTRIFQLFAELEQKTGVTFVPLFEKNRAGMTATHLFSTCRMAESAEHGVVDAHHQVFGHENLYVTDASALAHALGVNPALTISAMAERAAAGIVARG